MVWIVREQNRVLEKEEKATEKSWSRKGGKRKIQQTPFRVARIDRIHNVR